MSYGKIVDYAPDKNIVKAGREGSAWRIVLRLSSQVEVAGRLVSLVARNLTTVMQSEDTECSSAIIDSLYPQRSFDIKVTKRTVR